MNVLPLKDIFIASGSRGNAHSRSIFQMQEYSIILFFGKDVTTSPEAGYVSNPY